MNNQVTKRRKFPIRFYRPLFRTFSAMIPIFPISILSGIVMLCFMPPVILQWVIYLYLAAQVWLLIPYYRFVPSSARYVYTNLLSYAVIAVLGLGSNFVVCVFGKLFSKSGSRRRNSL